jgi:hypothetical protein
LEQVLDRLLDFLTRGGDDFQIRLGGIVQEITVFGGL